MTSFLLHLLRHGEPELSGRMLGRTDSAATAAGVAACVAQAEGLGQERLVTSDLARARTAAEAIGAASGQPVQSDPRWRELDFGSWDGLAAADVDQVALARFWDDPEHNPPPEGERWSTLTGRVSEAIAALDPVSTLVVTHGGAMRAALAVLCGFDLKQTWAIDLPYAALLSLRVWDGTPRSAQIVGLFP